MIQACRDQQLGGRAGQDLSDRSRPDASHAGLVLDRYALIAHEKQADDLSRKAHQDLRKRAAGALSRSRSVGAELGRSGIVYCHAFNRWKRTISASGLTRSFQVRGRVIVGLGNANVLDTGVTLHHTYGVPVIPGTALKGLAARYAHDVWGPAKGEFLRGGTSHRVLFGSSNEGGLIHFHDAWWDPSCAGSLVEDVLTPHHSSRRDSEEVLVAPTDFDDPNPVAFLSTTGVFLLALTSLVPTHATPWGELAFELLSRSLGELGVGGKSNVGYGRLLPVT